MVRNIEDEIAKLRREIQLSKYRLNIINGIAQRPGSHEMKYLQSLNKQLKALLEQQKG